MKWTHLVLAMVLLEGGTLSASGFGVGVSSSAENCEHGGEIRRLVHAAIETSGFDQPATSPTDDSWCASVPPLPQGVSLEVVNAHWDVVLRSYEFRLRCQSPSICLPFLVRWPAGGHHGLREIKFRPGIETSKIGGATALNTRGIPLVKPGQIVTLVWAEGWLHLSRKVVCLDLGRAGQQVRTRGLHGGRIVRARVASAGLVEAEL